jgi:single-strand DNA-binding protein
MLNRVELIGHLTADPELRYSPSGTPYCFIRLATNRVTASGRHAEFHFVIAWHALAERAAEFLRLGDRAYVDGRIETNAFTDKDGRRIERIRIVANQILALERRKERRNAPAVPAVGAEATHIANAIAQSHVAETVKRDPAEEGA